MHTFVTILLVLGFCVALPLVLLSVVYDLLQRIAQHEPSSRDPGPVIHGPSLEQSGR